MDTKRHVSIWNHGTRYKHVSLHEQGALPSRREGGAPVAGDSARRFSLRGAAIRALNARLRPGPPCRRVRVTVPTRWRLSLRQGGELLQHRLWLMGLRATDPRPSDNTHPNAARGHRVLHMVWWHRPGSCLLGRRARGEHRLLKQGRYSPSVSVPCGKGIRSLDVHDKRNRHRRRWPRVSGFMVDRFDRTATRLFDRREDRLCGKVS